MIIIEGADGSGKTTLSNMLLAAFPKFRSIHSPGPLSKETLKERMFWVHEITKLDYVITDRLTVFSEYVYGNVLRNKSLIDHKDISLFITNLKQNPTNMVVFCDRDFTPIQKDHGSIHLSLLQKRQLEKSVDKNLEKIKEKYRELFKWLFSTYQKTPHVTIKKEEDIITLFNFIRERYR